MSEDCLYLNLWTPATSAKAALPVMVWIYGGGFTNGSPSTALYSGDELAKRGVVIVNLIYRVGALGFMAHPELTQESENHTSGNYGLLDQIAALQWIQRNIAAFGGDPNRVTIFGQSAGSTAVSMLMAMPLFHRAIGQSGAFFYRPDRIGTAQREEWYLRGAERNGVSFGAALGADSITAMRGLTAGQIVQAQTRFPMHPILDGYVLPQEPYEVFSAGRQNDVPLLIGTNADEGRPFIEGHTIEASTFLSDARRLFGGLLAGMPDQVLAHYPSATDEEAYESRAKLEADIRFGYEAWTWARLQARTGRGKVFFYRFAHAPPVPESSPFAHRRAGHGMEMYYTFAHLEQTDWPWTAYDHSLADAIASYWTNFARTGNPNGKGLPRWPAFTNAAQRAMIFGDSVAPGIPSNLGALEALDRHFATVHHSGRRQGE